MEIRRRYLLQIAGKPILMDNPITIGDFAEEYKARAANAVTSPRTFSLLMTAFKKLLFVTGSSLLLLELSLRHADMLIALHKFCKRSSVNCYIRFLKIIMNKAVAWEYLAENPFGKSKKLKESKEPPRFIPPDWVMPFLQDIKDLSRCRLLAAYIFSGRRRSELWSLRWENIRLEEAEYYIESANSKSNVSRWYPMHPMFKSVLFAIGPKPSGRVFAEWAVPTAITLMAKQELRAGGYPDLSLHKVRHTFAILLKEKGVDLDTIGKLLGHSNRSATEIYAHITEKRQRVALSAIPCGTLTLVQ